MDEQLQGVLNLPVKVPHEAKLKELLHRITSAEIKLCSDATKEFGKILRSDDGGELLRQYVRASPKCSELLDSWKLRQGKEGMSYMFELIANLLSHYEGKYKPNDAEVIAISRDLDKFARLLVAEYLGDVYKELNSKEAKRQKAALLLIASIVRRGSTLASEVSKCFDFKLSGFSKLVEQKRKKNEKMVKNSLRKSYVGFAMSFLEVGKPGLLRWVLQQKEMYSGVLRGLGNDDDETVIYVLSTLRDRVLAEESLVPPSLRSVLFGNVTLEQLINISGREDGGPAAELAYNLLVLVCTDPSNGLMPDLTKCPIPLRGNPKRILGLMKKLQATEIQYHRDLLLAIVNGRPSFGLSYLEEFPYNLEDYMSPSWIAAVSLAASLVSSINNGLSREFINSQSNGVHLFVDTDVQSVMKHLFPRPFSRSMINRGLLHADFLVKHGTLRFLLELLKLLDALIGAWKCRSSSTNQVMHHMEPIKLEVQNDFQALLPDPQVLLTLLSSLDSCSKTHDSCLKRTANHLKPCDIRIKKLKMDIAGRDIDIVVGGISSVPDVALSSSEASVSNAPSTDVLDDEEDLMRIVREIWGLETRSMIITTSKEADNYLHSKLLDALRYFRRTVPHALDESFEFFIGLLNNPLESTVHLHDSLLSLLMEYIEWRPNSEIPLITPPNLYKHLQSFVKLSIFSTHNGIRHQAYRLAKAAMFSTGAFDRNFHEIEAWLLFLPGYQRKKSSLSSLEVEVLHSFCPTVISFLCDAVSTVGNNLIKYWDLLKNYFHSLEVRDLSIDFSPLIICVLEKCLRLIRSNSGTYSLPEKSMVLLFTCSTIKYLLQTQVDAEFLSTLLNKQLADRLGGWDENEEFLCQWKSLKNFLVFVLSISHQQGCWHFSCNERSMDLNSSFRSTLGEVERLLSNNGVGEIAGITIAFISSIVCVEVDEILMNMPKLVVISHNLQGLPLFLLSSLFFVDHSALFHAFELWPQMFCAGLDIAISDLSGGWINTALAGVNHDQLFDTTEATAFSSFLKQAPFHVLFSAMMCVNGPYLSELSKMQELLLDKLSECTSDCSLILNLRLVLHWTHQIQSYHNLNPSAEIEQLSNICVILVKKLLAQLLVSECSPDCSTGSGFCSSSHKMHEAVKIIFTHPSVLMSSSLPLGSVQNIASNIDNNFDGLNILFREEVHHCCNPILNILSITLEYLWAICGAHLSASKARDVTFKEHVRLFKSLQQRLFLEFKDRFDQSVCTKDLTSLIQTFYTLHALSRFLSPFLLLELVDWMFSRVELDDSTARNTALSVGCSLAAGAFSALSNYLQQQIRDMVPYNLFWEVDKNIKTNMFEQIYSEVVKFAMSIEIDCADRCLLEAVSALYRQKHIQQQSFHPLLLAMGRIIMITPVEIISHCIYKTNKQKAKFLFILTAMSSLHSLIFGQLFMDLLSRISDHDMGLTGISCDLSLSEDHILLLLPSSLSYLNSISLRLGEQNHKDFKHVPYFYSRILLNGFSQWKSFVSRDIFEEDYGDWFPCSDEQLLYLVDCSLLGKSLQMLRYHFAVNGDSMMLKKRLKLFKFIYPNSASQDELLDCNCQVIDCYSLHQSLNIVNRIIAKISLCKILLFHGDASVDIKDVPSEMGSKVDASRIRFMNMIVDVWHFIVKKFSLASDQSVNRKCRNISSLYNHLEVFLLRNIIELIVKMHDDLIRLESIPFLEQLFRSALLYRFHDSMTLEILQVLFTQLYEGKLSYDLYLQLLLAHSQLSSTICSVCEKSHSSPADYFLKPPSSILKCLVFPFLHHYESDRPHDEKTIELSSGKLQIIKLLRILLLKNAHQSGLGSGNDSTVNYEELHTLLCHSYGAMLSQIDLDTWKLMQEIEYICNSVSKSIANVECLWGTAAMKVNIEYPLEQCASNIKVDSQEIKEWSTNQVGENIPVDPDICTSTVLFFPYERITGDDLLSVTKMQPVNVGKMFEIYSSNVQVRKRYDPLFILRFSIHLLSKGLVEPVNFATLRLLAIAFASMSSPDLGIRRLAYETLGRFKNALEKCQKRKDVMGLRLLLTSVQNSIEEPWQRIPSVIAIFAAEASCVLLDPSHDHFAAICTLLIHSSKLNLQVIPLFDDFLWSTSVNFKAERLWILRLVYVGLNSDDDAMLYIRNSILESIMSFYMSPLSDFESKELIIEIIQKSIKLRKVACHLVKHCSLFSWFSSLISVTRERFNGEERFFLKQVLTMLKVVDDVISIGSISKWLQNFALEQLAELSSNLFSYILHDATLMSEAVALLNPLLQMIVLLLKISQKRKICQPHFTLSIEGLYKIYQVVSQFNHATIHVNPGLALEAILLNAPPVNIFLMSEERLESFVVWAISTAIQSESSQNLISNKSQVYSSKESGEEPHKNSLVSKFIRWLTAFVIIGKLYQKSDDMDPKFVESQNFSSLYSLLQHIDYISGQRNEIRVGGEKLLASTIFYLQLILGVNNEELPSIVSALCLLLFNASDSAVGKIELLEEYSPLISSLCSRIQCPLEANPAWRWSFYQPWKDPSLEQTDVQKMEQYHACQILLVIISNMLGGRKLESASLSHLDIERSDVFKWERSLLETDS